MITGRNEKKLMQARDDLAKRTGGEVHAVAADMTKETDIAKMVATAKKKLGGVDILVNNAGQMYSGLFAAFKDKEMQTQLDTKLFALSENYPNLKANANFQQLQSDLSDIENKLAASRRFFNNAVQEYNTGIQVFPASLFAAMFGFAQRPFFDLGTDRTQLEQAPSVKF